MFSRYAVTTFRQTGRFICRCGVSTFRSSRVLTFYRSNARTLCRFRNMGPPPRLGRPHRGWPACQLTGTTWKRGGREDPLGAAELLAAVGPLRPSPRWGSCSRRPARRFLPQPWRGVGEQLRAPCHRVLAVSVGPPPDLLGPAAGQPGGRRPTIRPHRRFTCQHCGKPLYPPIDPAAAGPARFCGGGTCRTAAHRARPRAA